MTCRTLALRCRWIAAVLLMLGGLLWPAADMAQAKKAPLPRRYLFEIDPKTPLAELLPTAPDVSAPVPPWLVRELSEVPEVLFAKPEVPIKRLVLPEPTTAEEKRKQLLARLGAKDKAMERTAHVIAKINRLNRHGRDRFLEVLRERRRDLAGLPFVTGDACRQSTEEARAFLRAVELVRVARSSSDANAADFWTAYDRVAEWLDEKGDLSPRGGTTTAAKIGALMPMLTPEDTSIHQGLVARLAKFDDADSTRALTRLTLFSIDASVRARARDALKRRRHADYTDLLLAALRYPWPAVAHNAAEAVIQLGRKDLVTRLVALLDEPDPRAPVPHSLGGKQMLVVREVVRLNHHRNCLLCHPPGNTPDVVSDQGFARDGIAIGTVPSPGVELPPPAVGYGPGSPDILVRADTTYLRQDFSRMQPVKDAAPWPDMQRFDYLVRKRVVTEQDAAAYQAWHKQQGPDYLAPHRQAALTALRALTGRDAEPTAKAWRAALAD